MKIVVEYVEEVDLQRLEHIKNLIQKWLVPGPVEPHQMGEGKQGDHWQDVTKL